MILSDAVYGYNDESSKKYLLVDGNQEPVAAANRLFCKKVTETAKKIQELTLTDLNPDILAYIKATQEVVQVFLNVINDVRQLVKCEAKWNGKEGEESEIALNFVALPVSLDKGKAQP